MKTAILISAFCLVATIQATLSTPVAKADIYTLSASGTAVGAFDWSVSTPSLITTTTAFSSFLSMTPPNGCTISGTTIVIDYLGSGDPFAETFFTPACDGFTEVSQEFFGAGSLSSAGTYTPAGITSPVWSLTITATPEPASLFLLGTGLLALVGTLRNKGRTVPENVASSGSP